MKRMLFAFSVAALIAIGITDAQELVTLSTPIVPPSVTNCHLERLVVDVDALTISAFLKCPNGGAISKTYDSTTTPTGSTLLHTLNIANFSSGPSLIRSIYIRLIGDGVITGTISGTPQ